ncbi:MAG: Teichoic acids export ATP-binding protein TagH [Bacteroidetes bacterium MED-G17]|nr:MAG: Teichoic acids export ATP-binding protein TagH [Bacteroidetes bacterium MED-G17]
MTSVQKRLLFEDLEDFTELGEYFDQPLIFGSTGMQARFNFGLLTSSPKDILVVDEGIGAGDQFFQVKAEVRLKKLYSEASILLMASHSDDLILKFCNRAIWMENGEIRKDGPAETVLTSYKESVHA